MSQLPFADLPATALPLATGFFTRQQTTRSMGLGIAPQDDGASTRSGKSKSSNAVLNALNAFSPVVSSGLGVTLNTGGIEKKASAPVNAPAFTSQNNHVQGRSLRSGSTRTDSGLSEGLDMSPTLPAGLPPPVITVDTADAVHPIPTSVKECKPDSMPKHAKTKHSMCSHGRRWTICKDCGGGSLCIHKKQKHLCKECGGKSRCSHGRQRSKCKACANKE